VTVVEKCSAEKFREIAQSLGGVGSRYKTGLEAMTHIDCMGKCAVAG
jgi:hypothetical protein